jgi:hypothetical protein
VSNWDNQGALNDNLQKQIAYLEMANHIQTEIEKLKVTEQTLRETIGEDDDK